MQVYKILHKPTGLYFTPSRGLGNLSSKGKIYPMMPKLKWASGSVRLVIKPRNEKPGKRDRILIKHFNIMHDNTGRYWIDKYYPVPDTDWEIIEL